VRLDNRDPKFEDVPEGFPVKSVKRAREHREEEIKRIQEKFDVSRQIAERILDESEGAMEPP
jgi:hypothetical protein